MPLSRKNTFFTHKQTFSKEYCEHMIETYLRSNSNTYGEDMDVSLVVEDGEIVCEVCFTLPV